MADYSKIFYPGAGYGFTTDADAPEPSINTSYRIPPGQFGLPTDPRTANQLDAVSKKLSTGAKVIEVSGVSPEMFEAMPEQHLTEINRLKKLAGAELTFHGPLVEPTGVTRRGWDPSQRDQAERQMWSAVERSHKLEPKGNIVVTFHSSNGLPDPETVEYNKDGKPIAKQILAVDERTGDFQSIGPTKFDYLKGESKNPYDELKKQNEEAWYRNLQNLSFHAYQGAQIVEKALKPIEASEGKTEVSDQAILEFYKRHGTEGAQQDLNKLKEYAPLVEERMREITHGDIYLRDAYVALQNLYNQAYHAAEVAKQRGGIEEKKQAEDTIRKLETYKKNMAEKLKNDYLKDPSHVGELGDEIIKGVNVLRAVAPPQTLRPLREFAIDQASETFGNLAFKAYKEFKGTAPIISIENPPAGSGLSRAEELKDLVKESRRKFAEKAQKELGLSESQAEDQAKKLIGVTWDVGHINMLRKYGAQEKQIVSQTETIAPFVKHVHLSDNFGLEHTELPMGMGNVPTKQMLDLISQYNKKAKKIIETGGPWYQFFQKSPLRETFEAFGSPIYSMKLAPQWNQVGGQMGGYSTGYGKVLPDYHFSTFGAGFSALPAELGGVQGGGRSRMSGAPME